jgi:cytochrome P450
MSVTSDDVFAELSLELGAKLVGDPYPIFAERRRETPVMVGDIMSEFGLPAMAASLDGSRSMFTFFRYDDIVAALRDPETYSSSVINDVFEPILGRTVLGMDGLEHRSYRGLLMPSFTRRLVEIWQQQILRPVARRIVGELGASPDKSANLVDFGLRYPVRMIYEIIGFPADNQQSYDEFARGGLTLLIAISGVNPSDPEQTARAVGRAIQESQGLYGRILEIVQHKRAHDADRDDFIGHLLRAEFEGAKLTDEQIAVFVRSLLPAASETTTRTWLNVMVCLLERPDLLDELRSDRSLILPAIDEGMRLEPAAVVLGRITTREVQVRGVDIPARAGVTLAAGSGNRDPEAFENPDEFDIHRKGAKPNLSFGFGPHLCPGMNTARIEMLEAIDALLDGLPNLRLDPDSTPPTIRGMMMRSPEALRVVWD